MATDEEYLHMQYFYNALIEFMYFIIIYIESYGFIFLATLSKHVKFFKEEVTELLSSFDGDTLEEKLHNFLIIMDCFVVSDNRVQVTERATYLRNSTFEDLILSKTVDLVLRGCANVSDICKNLNFNNVIFIDKKNLLDMLKRSTHFSIEKNQTLSLLHFHGIFGFEECSCNRVICYFQDILQHGKKLSLDEIECYGKSIFSSCGIHHMLPILCILYCSGGFNFENGQLMLCKKPKKYHKQKPLDVDLLNKSIVETTVPIGQIVLSAYGPYIRKWTGEVCSLEDSCGFVYCVTDFTNGEHGMFKIYFNKASLKLISEISSLKEYLQIRDTVQFDAKYHCSENFDYWKATRIKIVNHNGIDYNESLIDEFKIKSEVLREKCVGNTAFCSFGAVQDFRKCFHVSPTDLIKIYQLEMVECQPETSNCDNSLIIEDDVASESYKSQTIGNQVANIHISRSMELPNSTTESISNFLLPDYLFVFGHVVVLMEDKGMAISKHENKIYNILFPKNSIYPLNKSSNLFDKGQKIFALIPYIEEVDEVAVASFVYGLSDDETNNFTNPKEFAKQFLPSVSLKTIHKTSDNNCCGVVNSLTLQSDSYAIDSKLRCQLFKLDKLVTSHCTSNSISRIRRYGLWNAVIREHFNTTSSEEIVSFIRKLARSLKKKYCARLKLEMKCRSKRKLKKLQNTSSSTSGMQKNVQSLKSSDIVQAEEFSKENSPSNNLTVKSKSLDFINASCSSLSSYKSFGSTNSSGTFYSCEFKDISVSKTNPFPSDKLDYKEVTNFASQEHLAQPLSPNSDSKFSSVLENFDEDCEYETDLKNVKNKDEKREKAKYFHIQSFPFLKHMFDNRKKRFCAPLSMKSNCKSCYKQSVKETACVSLITDSFFFYSVNINGYSIVLPLPRRVIPERLQRKMKLNSCNEIMLVPNTLLNLSHILSVNINV